jgi:hypothetical protein
MLKYSPELRDQAWVRYHVKDTEKGPQVWEVKHTMITIKDEQGLPGKRLHLVVARNVLDVSFLQACMKIFWGAGIVGCRGSSLRRTADEDEKASGRTWGSGEQPATVRAVASAS